MTYRSLDEIAVEAYIYLYPLVIMEVTKQQLRATSIPKNPDPANLFVHQMNTATDKWRSVARPNMDTLFSAAWVDLSGGPAILTLPPSGDRYHMFQMLDFWTDTFAVPGSRASGPNGITVKIVGPGFTTDNSDTDADIILRCPTPTMWILGRTAATSSDDLEGARDFIRGCSIISLSDNSFTNDVSFGDDSILKTPPVSVVDSLSARDFFEIAAAVMRREGAHGTDGSVLMRLRDLGIQMTKPFSFADQSPEIQKALEESIRTGKKAVISAIGRRATAVNGWTYYPGNTGIWGNDYIRRAVVARFGLAANPTEDAIYLQPQKDDRGERFDGGNSYVMHFPKGQTPPAKAFWSITAYDRDGFLIANPLDRFGIRSRDDVRYNADGSLDIYLGPECPDPHGDSNWIPTVPGFLGMSMRIYMPKDEFLNGEWAPPQVVRLEK